MLILKDNPLHPETGAIFIRFKDGEEGFLRMVSQCEKQMIAKDGRVTREKRRCEAILISS